MSTCIKDLFDYDLVKKRCRYKNILLKSNFHKIKNMSDGFKPQCKFCTKKYYLDNRERKKEYYLDNRDRLQNKQNFFIKQNSNRIKEYRLKYHNKIMALKNINSKNRYKTAINFR